MPNYLLLCRLTWRFSQYNAIIVQSCLRLSFASIAHLRSLWQKSTATLIAVKVAADF